MTCSILIESLWSNLPFKSIRLIVHGLLLLGFKPTCFHFSLVLSKVLYFFKCGVMATSWARRTYSLLATGLDFLDHIIVVLRHCLISRILKSFVSPLHCFLSYQSHPKHCGLCYNTHCATNPYWCSFPKQEWLHISPMRFGRDIRVAMWTEFKINLVNVASLFPEWLAEIRAIQSEGLSLSQSLVPPYSLCRIRLWRASQMSLYWRTQEREKVDSPYRLMVCGFSFESVFSSQRGSVRTVLRVLWRR